MIARNEQVTTALAQLPLTEETKCSYFPNRSSRTRAFHFSGNITPHFLEALLVNGYRRCGDTYYQYQCRDCCLCVNYRIDVQSFKPSRSGRRVERLNEDLQTKFQHPEATAEKEEMYVRYQRARHAPCAETAFGSGGNRDRASLIQSMKMQMFTGPDSTCEMQLYLQDRLIGFGILDVAVETVSAVYFVFDPEFSRRSPGTLAILRGIAWARENGFRYYHLGHFIPGHPKMEYKKRFTSAQVMIRPLGVWSSVVGDAGRFVTERLGTSFPTGGRSPS